MKRHPLELFKYCPRCGSDLFEINNIKSKKCGACHFIYYFNPSAAAVAVIEDEKGRVLVGVRAKDPAKGTLDLPGGFADLNETIEEAVKREVREETNLEIEKLQFLFSIPNIYLYSALEVHTMDFFFRCSVTNFENMLANDDVSKLMFIPKHELHINDFGMQSVRQGIKKLLETSFLMP